MREKPILFKGEMVKAILSGAKTQTRRLVNWNRIAKQTGCTKGKLAYSTAFKSWAVFGGNSEADLTLIDCPHGDVGDRLWVKETHYYDCPPFPKSKPTNFPMDFYYRADGECCDQIPECQCGSEGKPKWRPSIFMHRWASRITLEIVSVRVERLQSITEEDAYAEGIEKLSFYQRLDHDCRRRRIDRLTQIEGEPHGVEEYHKLWESINGKGSWAKNPWVWAITFKRI